MGLFVAFDVAREPVRAWLGTDHREHCRGLDAPRLTGAGALELGSFQPLSRKCPKLSERCLQQYVVRTRVWEQCRSMKANIRHGRLFGWSVRFGMAAVAVAFAASGFAHPNTGTTASNNKSKIAGALASHKQCYVMLSSSPFPQPCDRLGATPTTASPMVIIGEAPKMVRSR
jgi:hypothetical protein